MELQFQLYVCNNFCISLLPKYTTFVFLMRKQIVIGGVVNAHVAVKFIYIKLCKGTQAMHANTVSARALWASICGVIWLLSWLIAESIPIFNDILGLAVSQPVVSFYLRLTKWT